MIDNAKTVADFEKIIKDAQEGIKRLTEKSKTDKSANVRKQVAKLRTMRGEGSLNFYELGRMPVIKVAGRAYSHIALSSDLWAVLGTDGFLFKTGRGAEELIAYCLNYPEGMEIV